MKSLDENLYWIANWFVSHATTKKELKLGTIDNPGWCLTVAMEGIEIKKKIKQYNC